MMVKGDDMWQDSPSSPHPHALHWMAKKTARNSILALEFQQQPLSRQTTVTPGALEGGG